MGQDCKAEKNGKACRRKKKDLKKDPSWWVRGGGYWTAHFLIGQLDIGAADSLVFFWTQNWGWVKLPLNSMDHFDLNEEDIEDTSSTAQGGGGSFKNRKPIGEVGCCESRMAERSH